MNLTDNRVLVTWTIICIVGGVVSSLAFGVLGQLLLG